MRLPLWLVDPVLRLAVKTPLRIVRSPERLRARFETHASRSFRAPPGMCCVPDRIRRADASMMDALWAQAGGPPGPGPNIILYLHGGAYLAGSPRTHRHLAASLAAAAGGRALLPDYRLAPEHPFPAAVDDAEAAYRSLLARGHRPGQIALAGDSAGGGLAAALVLRAHRAGLPMPGALALFSPWADLTFSAPSLRRNAASDAMLPVGRMPEVIGFYLAGASPDAPEASPARAQFTAPPPALILASRSEILADDARALASALEAGGGDVRLELWPRMPHAWPIFVGRFRPSDEAVALAGRFLAERLAG